VVQLDEVSGLDRTDSCSGLCPRAKQGRVRHPDARLARDEDDPIDRGCHTVAPPASGHETYISSVDALRFAAAVLAVVSYPAGLVSWLLVHRLITVWRLVGPT